MARPYPWDVEKTFSARLRILYRLKMFVSPFASIIILLTGPLAFIAVLWGYLRFKNANDSYKIRPMWIGLIGLVSSVVMYGIFGWVPIAGFVTVIGSLIAGNALVIPLILTQFAFHGLPFALIVGAIWLYLLGKYHEYASRAYLRSSNVTKSQIKKMEKVEEMFASSTLDPDRFEIGYVKNDIIPWRQNRRGMVVGTEFENLKHGYLAGANGTGKTIAAMNIAAEYVENGWSVVFPDFKGDRKTENMLAAIAKENNVPFYSFWSNNNDTGFHYDPLMGVTDISPASIIVTAFDFVTEGPAKYYTDQVEKYLAIQFTVLKDFDGGGKRADESLMDWLLRTSDPEVLTNMLKPAAGGRDKDKAADARILQAQIKSIKRSDLSGLEANLSKMINTIGNRMRPSEHMIDLRKAAEEKAIVYFGLPSSGDKIVMRALGSLVLRDLVAMASERQAIVGGDIGTPVLIMPDEVSQLQEKAEVMLELLQQGRSAKMMLFPAMQTFGSFTEKFIRELMGNSPTAVVLKVTDFMTAQLISENLGTTIVRAERREISSEQDAIGTETQTFSGRGSGNLEIGPRVPIDEITNLPRFTAFVYFPESGDKATIEKPKKSRVKGDLTSRDIPTTRLLTRDYVLAAEDDINIVKEMLQRSLSGNFGEWDSLSDDDSFIEGEVVEKEEDIPLSKIEVSAVFEHEQEEFHGSTSVERESEDTEPTEESFEDTYKVGSTTGLSIPEEVVDEEQERWVPESESNVQEDDFDDSIEEVSGKPSEDDFEELEEYVPEVSGAEDNNGVDNDTPDVPKYQTNSSNSQSKKDRDSSAGDSDPLFED